MDQSSVTPQAPTTAEKDITKSRPAVVVLSVLFILSLAGVGVLGYTVYIRDQTIKSAEVENERLVNLNKQPNNGQASGGRDLVNESAIDGAVLNYLQASKENTISPVVSIEYLDKDFMFARVVANKNLGKDEQGVQKGDVLHTFILKAVPSTSGSSKSWVIISVDANTAEQQKTVQDAFAVPPVVFTDNMPA